MENKKEKCWVVYGMSESGDNYGPWVFKTKPSDKKLKQFLVENIGDDVRYLITKDEDDKGCGIFGTWLHLDTKEVKIND